MISHMGALLSLLTIIGSVQVIESMLKNLSFRGPERSLDDVKGKVNQKDERDSCQSPKISFDHLGQHLYGIHLSRAGGPVWQGSKTGSSWSPAKRFILEQLQARGRTPLPASTREVEPRNVATSGSVRHQY